MKNIAAKILAAGSSKRFGKENKLLADFNGKPLLSSVLNQTAALPFSERLVVVHPTRAEVKALCDAGPFEVIENPNAAEGMATSIAAGVEALTNADAVALVLGDMPTIKHTTYAKLIDAFLKGEQQSILAPAYQGARGHPVFFSRFYFKELAALTGDKGARSAIEQHYNQLNIIEVDDPGVLSDIDTQEALLKARKNNPQCKHPTGPTE